ncbi:MAG TPA: M56 family metallopeptidase [Puia sp.]|uniref:M56 family metallopeptidase n=1 Tax=Puia sp. TaxID=2045100 RepID=UPI002D0E7377|nr:M56 family metallopeptidase [Puia sp.]HVU98040.1 M56 family metallopeptidase [Puia sp.]
MILYLLQVALVSGLLTAWYYLALRNRRLHGYNRAYLLGSLALSLVLPAIPFHWTAPVFAGKQVFAGTLGRVVDLGRAANNAFPIVTIACWTAAAASGALLGLSVWRIVQVYRLKARAKAVKMPGYTLVETDDPRTPFSFFNNLFWQRDADRDDPVNRRILRHEIAHIRGRHSWDGLFAQLACCLCWMNPFFWIIRRELTVVHEFIADAATGMEGDTEGFARMLLQSLNQGRFLQPVQGFFQSPIKRRLIMLQNTRMSRRSTLRKTLVAPVLLAVVVLLSCSKTPGGHASDAANPDAAKLAKEQLDWKTRKLIGSSVMEEMKKRADAAAAAGMSQMEYKLMMERKLQETEKQMKQPGLSQ